MSALERATTVMEHLDQAVGSWGGPQQVEAAKTLALISIAESLLDIAVQLERIQRLGAGPGPRR